MNAGNGSNKTTGCLKIAGIGIAVIFALAFLGAIISPADETSSVANLDQKEVEGESTQSRSQSSDSTAKVAEEAQGPTLTGPQRNAVRSANRYLDFKGFSREGLIEQLSSDAGDGYEVADATAAVDSLTVDWNEQAARSAEGYLNMMGFSCKGLIEQLSSSAGDGFTVEQATYGAKKAGAC